MDIVALIGAFAKGLFQISEDFYDQPGQFAQTEQRVADLSNRTAADFLAMLLTDMDEMICANAKRKKDFKIQRHRERALITSVGDIVFTHTLFKENTTGKTRVLLDEMIGLPDHERFSAQAEAKVLSEAQVFSYQHAADSIQVGGQKVSKVAVMNKVHGITEELPEPIPVVKKQCKYLYIEADEDHIHGQRNGETATSMMGKLVYLFEGKEDVCAGKRRLITPHFMSGLYTGSDRNKKLWEEIQKYIETHYDTKALKRVYISGDGGAWIRAGADHVDRSVLVQDRFHLMKYINRASNLMLDEANIVKGKFYKYIYKDKRKKVQKLLAKIRRSAGHDKEIAGIESYIVGNWEAIQTAFHDKHVLGCSAEGHVSNVLSDRMSSRPMGWSEIGSDRMCRLRCYVKNYGTEHIIDLVEYRRKRLLEGLQATGTDGYVEQTEVVKKLSKEQRNTASYIERLQATIAGMSARKALAIRERLNGI